MENNIIILNCDEKYWKQQKLVTEEEIKPKDKISMNKIRDIMDKFSPNEKQTALDFVEEPEIIREQKPFDIPKGKDKKKQYPPEDWAIYNQCQYQEKLMSYRIISDTIDSLQIESVNIKGRPNVDINDMLKTIILKSHTNLPARRLHSELVLYRGLGYIKNIYSHNTILKYMGSKQIQNLLQQANLVIVQQLAPWEKYALLDSTGISSQYKSRWVEVREDFQKHKEYLKLHVSVGSVTKAIFAFRITKGTESDCPMFKPLLEDTCKLYDVEKVMADAGYLSEENCNTAEQNGAVPYICIKKNTRRHPKGSKAWKEMVNLAIHNPEEFAKYYHKRSLVESLFSMLKQKLGGSIRAKNDETRRTEIMGKIFSHNVFCLGYAMLQFGIKPNF